MCLYCLLAFFHHLVGICCFIGRSAFINFILPCIEQATMDSEEGVVQKAGNKIYNTNTIKHGLIKKAYIQILRVALT